MDGGAAAALTALLPAGDAASHKATDTRTRWRVDHDSATNKNQQHGRISHLSHGRCSKGRPQRCLLSPVPLTWRMLDDRGAQHDTHVVALLRGEKRRRVRSGRGERRGSGPRDGATGGGCSRKRREGRVNPLRRGWRRGVTRPTIGGG